MEKATQAMRRSGTRIKSLGSGHSDLQMVIAQLKEMRLACKSFMAAQNSAVKDLLKWSLNDENGVIQDSLTQVRDLFVMWTEVQMDLAYHMKDFRHQFETILDSAKQVDLVKADLSTAETKVVKLKKERRKSELKETSEEAKARTDKISDAEKDKEKAGMEVAGKISEHESVKQSMIRKGLLNLTEAYIEYGRKCEIIFSSQRDIILQVSAEKDKNKGSKEPNPYTGSLMTAKEKLKTVKYKKENENPPPPPYSENPPYNPFYEELSTVPNSPPLNEFSQFQNQLPAESKLPLAASQPSNLKDKPVPVPKPRNTSVPVPKPRNSFLFYPALT